MKEINTHQALETKIRIYESWFLKELSDYFEKHKKDYRTKNDFYVSLIRVGLETEKIRDENYADYNGKLQSISDKLTEFSQKLDNTNGANNSLIRDLIIQQNIYEKLLSRVYNLCFALNNECSLNPDYVRAGMYDDLPETLEEYKRYWEENRK